MKNILKILKNAVNVRSRSSAGKNASLLRLMLRGITMYLSQTGFSFMPLSVFFIVNSGCNLRCKMCDIGQKNAGSIFYRNLTSNSGQMTLDNFKMIVGQLPRSTFISITSTEPLLWEPLTSALEWVVKTGRQVNVTTNGYLLPQKSEDLLKTGMQKLTISIDGPEAIHDSIRGVPGVYKNVIEGIHRICAFAKKINAACPQININTVLSPLNQGKITEFLLGLPRDLIKLVNVELMTFCTSEIAEKHNEIYGSRYPASQTCLSGGIDLKTIDINLLMNDLIKAKSLFADKLILRFPLDRDILHNYFFKPEVFLSNAHCVFPYFAAQINSKGEIIGLTRCYPVSFGNVLTEGFKGAWNSKKMRAFRLFLKNNQQMLACSRCEGLLYDL